MADNTIKLQNIAVIVYRGDYHGNPPPVTITDLKAGDLALDTSYNILWEFTGSKWGKKSFVNGGKIYLDKGDNLNEIVYSAGTKAPKWMDVYAGDDDRIPRDLQISASTLVVHHRMTDPPIMLASYYNSKDGKWYNIRPLPGAVVTSSTEGWSAWIGYLNRISKHKSIVSIFDIGAQNPMDSRSGLGINESGDDPGGGGGGGVESPADKLSAATVGNLAKLSNNLKIDDSGNLIVGTDGEVVTRRKKFITRTHLDENNVLWLDYPPISVISPAGDVFHMNSKYDEDKGKYRLDFSSITMAGSIWTVIY